MNGQPHNVDDHVDDMTRSCRHLSQCVVQHIIQHAHCAQTCEVCCLHPRTVTVDCYQLYTKPTATNIQKRIELMSSTSFWTCPSSTRNRLRKKGAISDIVGDKWVLHVLRLIHDGDGF